MTRQEFVALLETMAEGWNGLDPEKAARCFAPVVDYTDPLRYGMTSRDGLRRFFTVPDGETQHVVWHRVLFDEYAQAGAAEYTYEGTYRYHGAVLIDVADGVVTRWREYQHVSELDWDDFVAGKARTEADPVDMTTEEG